ncbi:MAG: sigma 54-dependent transcriptional regulator, partial [Myxococcales bacterium]|nr:sigma 54-dependent transcriptional regulator [Myxococcales bacterium]
VTRMATLAQGGRIDVAGVEREVARLRHDWAGRTAGGDASPGDALVVEALGAEGAAELDRFDRVQLADVLRVCKASKSLSDAGRTLFAVSRTKRSSVNDADRLRKYLARFDLRWQTLPWH